MNHTRRWTALIGTVCVVAAIGSRTFPTILRSVKAAAPTNTIRGRQSAITQRELGGTAVQGTLMSLTKEVIDSSYDVLTISRALFDDDPTTKVPGAEVFTDEPDRALWVKKDDTCFSVFRATTPQAADWVQNFPFGDPISFQSPLNNKTCTAYAGFHEAYFNTSFVDTYRESLRGCVNSCGTEPCKLVIGGASQGAAIAAIAAVDFEDMNPLLLTFGQPPTLISNRDGPCDAINPNRYLRFINTIEGTRPFFDRPFLLYDIVPALIVRNRTDNIGNFLVLSENNTGVLQFPNEGRPFLRPTLWTVEGHLIVSYLPTVERLRNSATWPIPVKGWGGGSLCNFDVECESGECSSRRCTDPSTGVSGGDGDPASGAHSCDGLIHWFLLGASLLFMSQLR